MINKTSPLIPLMEGERTSRFHHHFPPAYPASPAGGRTGRLSEGVRGRKSISYHIKNKTLQHFFNTKPTVSNEVLHINHDKDGHLEVESDEGIGTRFIIEIPLTTLL